MPDMWSNLWRYRYFIISSITTEFRSRFARSRLGGFWMILNPLMQVLMFAFVLSSVLSAKLPGINSSYAYAIYLMTGMLGWTLFTEIVTRCVTLFVDNSNILKKLAFPKIALPLIVTGSALVNNTLLFISIMFIFCVLGHSPGLAVLWLPILVLINVALALGVGLILGVLNVFMRDVSQIVPIGIQFLFWITPVVYMVNIIPVTYQRWLLVNPLIPIVTSYQDILLYNQSPKFLSLGAVLVFAMFLLIFSLFLFRKASPELVDQL